MHTNVFAQTTHDTFFDLTDSLLLKNVSSDGKVDYESLSSDTKLLDSLIEYLEDIPLLDANDEKAVRINAYNLYVINNVVVQYPVNSVQDISGFFDRSKITYRGKSLTLNQFEKRYLIEEYEDARLHFVLVCGAKSCPPLLNKAYRPELLENQLEEQLKRSFMEKEIMQVSEQALYLSKIFLWYGTDFGNKKATIDFINNYSDSVTIPYGIDIKYLKYDWSLNGQVENKLTPTTTRYLASSIISKGAHEFKIFNNLYSQNLSNYRSTYNTSTFSYLFGLSNVWNVGFTGRFRKVTNYNAPSSIFDIFLSKNHINSRVGLTALGPTFKYGGIRRFDDFSLQLSLTFPTLKDNSGTSTKPFIDWSGVVFYFQSMKNWNINPKLSIFGEVDLWVENITLKSIKSLNVSFPLTTILNYFPSKKWTLYSSFNFSPYLLIPFDYFFQVGVGIKYQITNGLELEGSSTYFRNKYIITNKGTANSINLGLRWSIF